LPAIDIEFKRELSDCLESDCESNIGPSNNDPYEDFLISEDHSDQSPSIRNNLLSFPDTHNLSDKLSKNRRNESFHQRKR
jgi:hypothetical protein